MSQTALPQGSLTPEVIEDMRSKIGMELRIDHSIFNEDATRLAILKFAEGIGDLNPLWCDPEHGRRSAYGSLVAPPSWVLACFAGVQFGWPGLGSFHSATDMRFHAPVRLGDKILPTCVYEGFKGPRSSRFADQVVVDTFRNVYRNQHEVVVAEVVWEVTNFERHTARSRRAAFDVELPHSWSREEVEAIEQRVLAEAPRGTQIRYWEDVTVGDILDGLTKGPLGITDEVAFVSGGGAPIPRLGAHAAALRMYKRHPGWAFRDPYTSALEPIFAVHFSKQAANEMGVPMQYDVGFQRQCWQVHLLTNWLGDTGWLKRVSAQYRAFVYLSDVIDLEGRVERTYVDDEGDHCVDVTTRAMNQRGVDVMPGKATLILPTRDPASDPIRRRL